MGYIVYPACPIPLLHRQGAGFLAVEVAKGPGEKGPAAQLCAVSASMASRLGPGFLAYLFGLICSRPSTFPLPPGGVGGSRLCGKVLWYAEWPELL